MTGCTETCPFCGGTAELLDGDYDFFGNAIRTFRAANPDQLLRFQAVAQAAAHGTLAVDAAEKQAAEIGEGFARLIVLAIQWGIPSLLVALVALWLQWQSAHSDDASHAEVMQELKRQTAANEQLVAELRILNAKQGMQPPPVYSTPKRNATRTETTLAGKANRHERRKANKLGRKR
jgi:hypothetical protein